MIIRAVLAFVAGGIYQVATNPFVQAALLVLTGHWLGALAVLAIWGALCAVAVTLSVERKSRLPGLESVDIFTAPDILFILGNEQEGNAPAWYRARHPKWPRWLCAFVFAAWRNKTRNLPFVSWLRWLHRPQRVLHTRGKTIGKYFVTVTWRGWLTELQWENLTKRRFGDIGPRLDQPDQWGGVSWAFRPFGKY